TRCRTIDHFDVVGRIWRSDQVDKVGGRAGIKRNFIDQLKSRCSGVENVGAGKCTLEIAGAGDIMSTVARGDEMIDVAVANRIIARGDTCQYVIYEIVASNWGGTVSEDHRGS